MRVTAYSDAPINRFSRWLRRLRCRLGLHHWFQSRQLTCADGYPPPWIRYIPPERHCLWCGKQEEWLPGYGGSEVGCWINKPKQETRV